MTRVTLRWLLSAGCLALAAAGPAPDQHKIERITAIPLHPGINTVPKFTPDGREAIVAQAWHENGNAHSYGVLLVLLRNSDGQFLVVPFERADMMSDVVTDDPHTGDDAVRSVRLAHAMVDGAPATLLLSATREIAAGASLPDAASVTYDVFRLVHDEDAVGSSPDSFRLLQQSRSTSKFCNATVALSTRFGLAAPAGTHSADGC